MLNKLFFIFIALYFQSSLAFLPNSAIFPELPKIGDFNPSSLQEFFNEFTQAKPDLERESRMIGEIEDSIMNGEIEYLHLDGDRGFSSVYMEPETSNPKGGVIILHSRGYHANWVNVVHPVRVGLAEKGWHSLSVQMPVLEKTAKYYDYVPIFPYAHERIEAAIDFYKQRGVDNIVLIAHGCGAHMSMSYIDKFGDDKISSYVGIGMGATDYRQKIVKRFPLDKMLVPVLDVFGENDFPGVIRLAQSRKSLMDISGNAKNAQIVIDKADHYYKEGDTSRVLVETIDNWLSAL